MLLLERLACAHLARLRQVSLGMLLVRFRRAVEDDTWTRSHRLGHA